jgi:outer membrane protein assembly factor BamA
MIRGYIPVGSRQVLAPMVSTLFLESPHYLVTDLFRFGGAESLRGFREDQFRGSSVVWGELEGRYMLQQNSYLFLFGAYGFYERPQLINEESDDLAFKDRLTSLGFGLAFQSTLGIIKFSYAVSPNENLANGNIHVGIRAGL